MHDSMLPYYFMLAGFICALISIWTSFVLCKTMFIMQDKVRARTFKIHKYNIPRCGGIGIFLSFVIITMFGLEIEYDKVIPMPTDYSALMIGSYGSILNKEHVIFDALAGLHFYVSCFIVLFSGILKDGNRNSHISFILLTQIIGFAYFLLSFSFLLPNQFFLDLCSIAIGLIFLFFTTNSINIIDGINGNVALTSLIMVISLFVVSMRLDISFILFSVSMLCGILLVLLYFNYLISRIFLGDSGAFLLGFIIAGLLFIGVKYYHMNICYAVSLYTYPMCEMILSIILKIRSIRNLYVSEAFLHFCEPNNYHLHFFLYKRFGNFAPLIINVFYAIFVAFITMFYYDPMLIVLGVICFIIVYFSGFYIFRTEGRYLYNYTK